MTVLYNLSREISTVFCEKSLLKAYLCAAEPDNSGQAEKYSFYLQKTVDKPMLTIL
jgi:hypothetical protein